MNFALSQRRADRHPVGLLVVVGLHALLAAVLVSARLADRPGEPPPVALVPLEPTRPPVKPPEPMPTPPRRTLQPLLAEPPVVPADPPPDAVAAKADDRVDAPEPTVVIAAVADARPPHDVARAVARAARIDAGAARCRPDYPAAAQRAGVTGVTRIRFSVDAGGRIAGSQILQPSGPMRENRLMDKAAADALAQCPVQVGTDETGRPVGTTTDVEYVWRLD